MVVKVGDVWVTLVFVVGRVCLVEDFVEVGDIEIFEVDFIVIVSVVFVGRDFRFGSFDFVMICLWCELFWFLGFVV